MTDGESGTGPSKTPWQHRAGRRAVLGLGAAGVAAGAGVVLVGVSHDGGSGSPRSTTENGTPSGTGTPEPAATSTSTPPPPRGEISDPRQRAGHLLRRAGFGPTPDLIEEFSGLDREEAADRLLDFDAIETTALDQLLAERAYDIYRPGDAPRQWLTRMARSPRQLQERMTLIWHGLLTSQLSQIGGQYSTRIKLMDAQIDLYRAMALPIYDDLLKSVSRDPAMMIYLNTVDSSAGQPNENYARELMELFSMGEGNYSEDDVREAARAFTGWRFTRPERRPADPHDPEEVEAIMRSWEPRFFVAGRLHDGGAKTFLGRTGNWGGDDIVELIAAHEAPSRFIPRRLFHEFVHDDPADDLLDDLAEVWNRSGHDIREVVRAILVSDEFYSRRAYRGEGPQPDRTHRGGRAGPPARLGLQGHRTVCRRDGPGALQPTQRGRLAGRAGVALVGYVLRARQRD